MKSLGRLGSHALAMVLLGTLAGSAAAQGGTWSDEFDAPGLLGRVFALSEYGPDLVAGGLTVQADGQDLGNVARFDGQRWQPLGSGIHGDVVQALALYQGELVVAGGFLEAGGTPVKSIARWNGTQWSPLGGGLSLTYAPQGGVSALAVYQNELYAVGLFDRADNVAVANVARWNGTQWSSVGSGFDGIAHALEVGGDGKLYAGGAFGHAGGVNANNIASWNGTSWSAVGPGLGVAFNSEVRALEWHASKLWAGGSFDVPGGPLFEKLASWDGSAWLGEGSFPDSAIGVQIYSLLSFGTDLYVGGNFGSVNGLGVSRIARLSGSTWNSIGGVAGFANTNVVLALAAHAGGVVVGGNFTRVGTSFVPGVPIATNSIAGFDGTHWKQISKGLGFNASVSGGMHWNGGLVAAGSFDEAGRSVSPFVAFFDGNDWSPLGQFDNPVFDTVVFQNELVVTGSFSSVDGQPFVGVAAFDGTSWHGFGGGFNGSYGGTALAVFQNQLYAGGIGGVKRWNGASWEVFAPQVLSSVSDMHVHGTKLYMAGYSYGSGDHIASWDGTAQQSVGGGMNGEVSTLASFAGDLIAGGVFTQAGGVAANRLARWNGSSWSAFPGITGQEVTTLAVFGGELHAGGNPLLTSGSSQFTYIARWDGTHWQPLAGGLDGSAAVLIPDDAAGRLYAGGSFTRAGGRPSWYFGRWDTGSGTTTAFCPGDGTAMACPCGNSSPVGNEAGCLNSTAYGGKLLGVGTTQLSADGFVLTATELPPTGFCVFFQGTGITLAAMGDGVRCTGGSLLRLATKPVAGTATFPQAGDPTISGAGAVPPGGGTRYYQCFYRDPLGPCGTAFNATSGVSVVWQP